MTNETTDQAGLDEEEIARLVSELGNKNGMERRHAREALEKAGSAATPILIEQLNNPKDNVRWEATKALVHIADPKAGATLVKTLMDESFEIQWLAAEALIALGKDAIKPLLEGVVHNPGSVYMRQGAHHVLHDLERRDELPPVVINALDDLRFLEPREPYPISAKRALEELYGKPLNPPSNSNEN